MKTFITLSIFIFLMTGCQSVSIKKDNLKQTKMNKSTENGIPREIYATNISFDAQTGQLKYTLPEAALVRLRIGIRDGGPLVRNLMDWEERGPGEHIEVWDGKDETRKINFGKRNDLMLVLMCIPKNSKERDPNIRGYRKSPKFIITFPESKSTNDQNVPVIEGVTSVRISLDPNDKTWLSEAKYELGLYIDNAFLMEDEEGTNPFTYKLDTRTMNKGLHTITVNLAVYDGEMGTESALVYVDK